MSELLHNAHRPLQKILDAQPALLALPTAALHLVLLVRRGEVVAVAGRRIACVVAFTVPSTAGPPAARSAARPADGKAGQNRHRPPTSAAAGHARLRGARGGGGGEAAGQTHHTGSLSPLGSLAHHHHYHHHHKRHYQVTTTNTTVTTISSPHPPSRVEGGRCLADTTTYITRWAVNPR
ncbi:hypothetical protein E2C01_079600 [Portunus trituberculatus]|uniref:Uncharacterized protein n=1 Tax=Portunus trituberculatus TaxID=210409 RepID=A0A5B7IJZ4_PORTR|nr:hypothetical protein [Portunus trituberculatus]